MVIPIAVSDPQASDPEAREHTHTLAVNRYGGLIALRSNVSTGQSLVLTHSISRASQECRVIYLGPPHHDKRQVGVEFLEPITDFWEISFTAPERKPLLD